MEEFYARLGNMRAGSPAERAVAAIWDDVTDRRGWRQEADQFDPEIRGEILDAWLVIIDRAFSAQEGKA
jgi:hypothetical protein